MHFTNVYNHKKEQKCQNTQQESSCKHEILNVMICGNNMGYYDNTIEYLDNQDYRFIIFFKYNLTKLENI